MLRGEIRLKFYELGKKYRVKWTSPYPNIGLLSVAFNLRSGNKTVCKQMVGMLNLGLQCLSLLQKKD